MVLWQKWRSCMSPTTWNVTNQGFYRYFILAKYCLYGRPSAVPSYLLNKSMKIKIYNWDYQFWKRMKIPVEKKVIEIWIVYSSIKLAQEGFNLGLDLGFVITTFLMFMNLLYFKTWGWTVAYMIYFSVL